MSITRWLFIIWCVWAPVEAHAVIYGSDNFDRANNSNLGSQNWNEINGDVQITSNQIELVAVSPLPPRANFLDSTLIPGNDYVVGIQTVGATNAAEPMVRSLRGGGGASERNFAYFYGCEGGNPRSEERRVGKECRL